MNAVLSFDEERALIVRLREKSDVKIVEESIAKLLRIVDEEIHKKSSYLATKGFDFDDVLQSAYLVALEAIESYNLQSKILPSRYIVFMVTHRLPRELRRSKYSTTIPDSWYKYDRKYREEEQTWIAKNKNLPTRKQINAILKIKATSRDIRSGIMAALGMADILANAFTPIPFELEKHDIGSTADIEENEDYLGEEVEAMLGDGALGAEVALSFSALYLAP